MLQQEKPDDFVLATGVTYSIKEMVEMVCKKIGIEIYWEPQEVGEIGIDRKTNKIIVGVDPKYYRPAEVELLLGDATKAKDILGWEPKLDLSQIFDEMIEETMKS